MRPSRLLPIAILTATLTAVVLLLTPAHGARSAVTGRQPATQPAGQAEILWDEWGTPHIFANDTEGLFRAYGWAQMHSHGNLLLRLYAQSRGNAAEYGGAELLESDRAVRIMALRERGQEWYAAQTPAFRRNIDAFAAGVNEYAAA